jgi:hypothetical protein
MGLIIKMDDLVYDAIAASEYASRNCLVFALENLSESTPAAKLSFGIVKVILRVSVILLELLSTIK